MIVRTLKWVALMGFCLTWCAAACADDKPETGFVAKTFDEDGKKVPYVVYVPKDYDGKKPYPVILFLHGADEKKPIPWGLGTYIEARGDLDFLCVFPHTEDGWAPGTDGDRHAIRALDAVMADYKAQRNRVYLTGFSMGGRGTYSLGAKYADRWAALVPVAADSRPEWAQKVKDIPIWAFHGADDDSDLNAAKGRQAVEYVRKAGGHPKYTEFPGVGHEPDHAYHNDELYAWLRKQRRNTGERWPGFAEAGFSADLDAAVDWGDNKVCFFRGDKYLRYDLKADQVDDGYPKPIAGNWGGMDKAGFDKGIDAAINLGNGKVYFFRGPNYVRYDIKADSVDGGFPQPIAGNWPGFDKCGFGEGIDAAINLGDGKVYFFRGDKYLRYDPKADRVDDGYPKPIAGNWGGMDKAGFDRGVRAAISGGNGKAYFFRGPKYVRYDIAKDAVDDGYPLDICP